MIESFLFSLYILRYLFSLLSIYLGRPSGGSAFYISTLDNTQNHGPASQGSKTEADSCFGKVVQGIDVVKRMTTQPGKGPSGFITDPANNIKIIGMTLLPGNIA
jgi:cyclophilin family peptidyl-prolyl cis-trans isomerase